MVGAVGDDVFAAAALAELNAASVDLSGVQTQPTATGTAIILVDGSGQKCSRILRSRAASFAKLRCQSGFTALPWQAIAAGRSLALRKM
ncbi:PfkB family carbohydrate kinase [Agrobacterium fabrum]|uniref:PfkB family carbohydrate kinase n=1 Tax=Agrobacterium fabrum TaxID=1176649 RepID=UPI00358DBFE0